MEKKKIYSKYDCIIKRKIESILYSFSLDDLTGDKRFKSLKVKYLKKRNKSSLSDTTLHFDDKKTKVFEFDAEPIKLTLQPDNQTLKSKFRNIPT